MITFKSTQDLNKFPSNNPAHPIIQELIDQLIRAYTWEGHPYIAEDYGYIVLIEPGDTERVLHEIWDDWTLLDIPWKDIMQRDDFFIAIFLTNNEHSQRPTKDLARAEWLLGSYVLISALSVFRGERGYFSEAGIDVELDSIKYTHLESLKYLSKKAK